MRMAEHDGPQEMCPNILGAAEAHGAGYEAAVALGRELLRIQPRPRAGLSCNHSVRSSGRLVRCSWPHEMTSAVARMLYAEASLATLDWFDLAACVRVGVSWPEAFERVQTGRDMEAIRVLSALGPT